MGRNTKTKVDNEFYPFPHTPHFAGSAVCKKGSKKLNDVATRRVLRAPLVVQEKLNGLNIGIGLVDGRLAIQGRRRYMGPSGQTRFAWDWAEEHCCQLSGLLGEEMLLFGELLDVRHTVRYTGLHSHIIFFDLYSKSERTFVTHNELCGRIDAAFGRGSAKSMTPPVLAKGKKFESGRELRSLLGKSRYSDEQMEGLYIRREKNGSLAGRYKLVGTSFAGKREREANWSTRRVEINGLAA